MCTQFPLDHFLCVLLAIAFFFSFFGLVYFTSLPLCLYISFMFCSPASGLTWCCLTHHLQPFLVGFATWMKGWMAGWMDGWNQTWKLYRNLYPEKGNYHNYYYSYNNGINNNRQSLCYLVKITTQSYKTQLRNSHNDKTKNAWDKTDVTVAQIVTPGSFLDVHSMFLSP